MRFPAADRMTSSNMADESWQNIASHWVACGLFIYHVWFDFCTCSWSNHHQQVNRQSFSHPTILIWLHHKAPINGPRWTLEQSSINGASIDLTVGFMSEIHFWFGLTNHLLVEKGSPIAILFYQFAFYKYSDRSNMRCHPGLPPRTQEIED